MPRFRYQATTSDGNITTGVIESADASEAMKQLTEAGWEVQAIELVKDAPHQTDTETTPKPEPLSRGERLQLTEHLADMVRAELPLADGFTALAEELPSGRLQRSLRELARQMKQGVSLEVALRDLRLPESFIALVRAGLKSGEPAVVLSQYAEHARRADDLRRRFAIGVGYPLVLVLVGMGVCLFFLCFLVPEFRVIFEDFGVELPVLTRVLMSLSDSLQKYGLLMLILLAIVLTVSLLLWGWWWNSEQKSSFQARLPVIGKLYRTARLARLYRLLSILVANKLPLPEALRLAGDGCGDAELRRELQTLATSVERGEGIGAVRGLKLPPPVLEMLFSRDAQSDSSTATEMYETMAELFEHQAESRARVIASYSEPLIIVICGGAVGFMVISLFAPLIRLLRDLS